MGKWKKPSEAMGEYLAEAVEGLDCQPRKMFGCPCYFVNNNMFCGVHEDTIIMRLSPADRTRIMEENDEVGLFDPMGGRPMKEYVAIPDTIASDEADFLPLIRSSYAYASALPPKQPRKKKKKKS